MLINVKARELSPFGVPIHRSEGGWAPRASGRPRLTAYGVPWAPGRACGGADREGAGERNQGLLLLRLALGFRGGAGMNR